MELRIKSIYIPQNPDEGSNISVDLFMLKDNALVGALFVTLDLDEDVMNKTLAEIARLAVARGKTLLWAS